MNNVQSILGGVFILWIVLLAGCQKIKILNPSYDVPVVKRADLLSGKALFGSSAKRITLPDDDVLGLNQKIREHLEAYVPRTKSHVTQARSLMRLVTGAGLLGMEYDVSKTYTAKEAYRKSVGNCLAFSYLFVAMARERGMDVEFQEVEIPPAWDHDEGDLYYFRRHINVRVNMKELTDYIVDIDEVNNKPQYRAWGISDKEAIALYYSNKAADYLYEGDIKAAFRYLVKGAELSPKDASIWSNLGVLYRKQGLKSYAEKAYFIALQNKGNQWSVLNNLSALYQHGGEEEKAAYYAQLAEEHRLKNPYVRFFQAKDAFEKHDYLIALEHMKVAVDRKSDEKKFYLLLVKIYHALGEDQKAQEMQQQAMVSR
ncbi:hypothetical protein [Paremcibacter congregatus]|uniref:Uncharacterized protein n=1 Tax=Paremcibacter congregatus TaxID=2043170 RepID=A0A2G4YM88_9PROT|nr:hypothetical protein [Paremcibacter congregatus]PHZ83430.1 hypothetical protein CRD36_17895 [Paremcibacter congregatus]QDE28102.1 hypothetical protein FIV45_12910 [Paremcibacter congregatus]